jgi:hypothetical protein
MSEDKKIVLFQDLLDSKARKEKELEFYNEELKRLQSKMWDLQKEITLTNDIIRLIETERLFDLKKIVSKH